MENNNNDFLEKRKKEIESNFTYFKKVLPEIIKEHRGKYALLKNKKILGYFSTIDDVDEASKLISDHIFSIQKVEIEAKNLGYYSYAMV